MHLYDNKQWQDDLDEIVSSLTDLDMLEGKAVLITGAAGLICSAVVDVLCRYNDIHNNSIEIYIAGRNREKMEVRFQLNRSDLHYISYDSAKIVNKLSGNIDYNIHGASNGSPNHIIAEPVETMLSNFLGMRELLEYGKLNRTARIVFISTSEVYGKKSDDHPSKVSNYGGIDILNSRSSYSISKCAAETLCESYYDEYGVESSIIRPGHIYGPTASETDNRVSSAWAYAVSCDQDIVMKSDGSQIRSYCYCLDSASAILKVLLKGESVKAYNISNPESVINIKTMAELLAKSADVELRFEVPTEADKKGFNPMKFISR